MLVGRYLSAGPVLRLLGGVCLQAQVFGLSEQNYSDEHT